MVFGVEEDEPGGSDGGQQAGDDGAGADGHFHGAGLVPNHHNGRLQRQPARRTQFNSLVTPFFGPLFPRKRMILSVFKKIFLFFFFKVTVRTKNLSVSQK